MKSRSGGQRQDLDDASRLALQTDPDHRVREAVARRTDDAQALAALARDPHPAVRSATLENPPGVRESRCG